MEWTGGYQRGTSRTRAKLSNNLQLNGSDKRCDLRYMYVLETNCGLILDIDVEVKNIESFLTAVSDTSIFPQ